MTIKKNNKNLTKKQKYFADFFIQNKFIKTKIQYFYNDNKYLFKHLPELDDLYHNFYLHFYDFYISKKEIILDELILKKQLNIFLLHQKLKLSFKSKILSSDEY